MTAATPGHALGAAAVVIDRAGRVLLVHHTYGPLNWELPGGGAEPGESAAAAVAREVLEETGLRVEIESLAGVYWEPSWGFGAGMHHFVFRCQRMDDAAPRADAKEVSECAFWPVDALPRPISDFTVRRIEDALAGGLATVVSVGERRWLE
ncbi:MAG: NUDIX domain-containing protein [Candidatus Limnocylindria bacterium]